MSFGVNAVSGVRFRTRFLELSGGTRNECCMVNGAAHALGAIDHLDLRILRVGSAVGMSAVGQ
jgi:hypothetical protein